VTKHSLSLLGFYRFSFQLILRFSSPNSVYFAQAYLTFTLCNYTKYKSTMMALFSPFLLDEKKIDAAYGTFSSTFTVIFSILYTAVLLEGAKENIMSTIVRWTQMLRCCCF
ncbi:hypothetical protein ACJX0J_023783, partial [Zea mays]